MRELQVHAVQLEEVLVLAHERVRRPGEDAHEALLREPFVEARMGRRPMNLGIMPNLWRSLGGHGLVEVTHLGGAPQPGASLSNGRPRRAFTISSMP